MPTPIPNIWQMQSQNDADSLIGALHHADSGVRQRAAAALRAIGAWHAVPALENALTVEPDWKAHATMSAALKYLDTDIHIEQMLKSRDVRGLIKMLNSSRLEEMLTAANALGEIGDKHATEALVVLFRNPFAPQKARLAVAEALLKLESAPAVVTLLRALRRDDWTVRRNAAAVLGQVNATWAMEPLIVALNDPVPIVRKTAEAALLRMNLPEAEPALREYEANAKARQTTDVLPTLSEAAALPAPVALPDLAKTGPLTIPSSRTSIKTGILGRKVELPPPDVSPSAAAPAPLPFETDIQITQAEANAPLSVGMFTEEIRIDAPPDPMDAETPALSVPVTVLESRAKTRPLSPPPEEETPDQA